MKHLHRLKKLRDVVGCVTFQKQSNEFGGDGCGLSNRSKDSQGAHREHLQRESVGDAQQQHEKERADTFTRDVPWLLFRTKFET